MEVSLPIDKGVTAQQLVRIQEALRGDNGQDQHLIAKKTLLALELMLRKNADYGSTVFDEAVLCPDTPVDTCILVRMSDKISRLRSLWKKGYTPQVAESVGDTMMDMVAYGILWLVEKERNSGPVICGTQGSNNNV